MTNRIVIIDSEEKSRRLLVNIATAGGFEALGAATLSDGLNLITVNCPKIVIIDPENKLKETIFFIKQLKEWSDCRIIAISSALPERHRIELLDSGADDYIEKPLAPGEFLARARVQLRFSNELLLARGMSSAKSYDNAGLCVDFDLCQVTLDGEVIHLTKNEFLILSLLCRYPEKVLTYDFIMKSIWGPQITGNTGILRVNIANIRRKIESSQRKFIHTENGIGYRLISYPNK